jgi:hypothetical protein
MSKEITVQGIVMPAVSTEEAKIAWEAYEALKAQIVTKNDIQAIQGKDFLKKSYWRKAATFFNLSTEIVEEKHEKLGSTYVWHFTAKAIAPNGRVAVGTGSCDIFEKAEMRDGKYVTWDKQANGWKLATPNSIHNIRSTAETRAVNRAISNLIGGGEVSAEEVAK